jgi:Protein of unknown function (DUF1266)
MFGFLKKKETVVCANSFIFDEDNERKAICSNDFFSPSYVFLDMKLCGENRDFYVNNNFFNLRYTLGAEASWNKNKATYLPSIKEALDFSYDISDELTYDTVYSEFMEAQPHAWNLVRIAGVTKDAYTVSYISLEKAKSNILCIGKKLVDTYQSWAEVATDFLLGKFDFNFEKESQGEDTQVYTDVIGISVMMDFLFNDKDSPLKRCPFDPNENLHASSNHIFKNVLNNVIPVPKRAKNMMKVYQDAYDWRPFVLIDDDTLEERDFTTYQFIKDELNLDRLEEIIYIHAFTEKNPEKSDVNFILTNKNLITVLNKKARKNKEYVYHLLSEINLDDLIIKTEEFEYSLNLKDKKLIEQISIGSKNGLSAYREILTDMIHFLVKVQKY